MILDALIMFLEDFLLTVIGFFTPLEAGTLSILSSLTGFIDLCQAAGYFLPLGTIAACLAVIIALNMLATGFFGVNWVIKRVRGG